MISKATSIQRKGATSKIKEESIFEAEVAYGTDLVCSSKLLSIIPQMMATHNDFKQKQVSPDVTLICHTQLHNTHSRHKNTSVKLLPK